MQALRSTQCLQYLKEKGGGIVCFMFIFFYLFLLHCQKLNYKMLEIWLLKIYSKYNTKFFKRKKKI